MVAHVNPKRPRWYQGAAHPRHFALVKKMKLDACRDLAQPSSAVMKKWCGPLSQIPNVKLETAKKWHSTPARTPIHSEVVLSFTTLHFVDASHASNHSKVVERWCASTIPTSWKWMPGGKDHGVIPTQLCRVSVAPIARPDWRKLSLRARASEFDYSLHYFNI